MKHKLSLVLILVIALFAALAADIAAQDRFNASQGADELRVKLLEVQTKESELQAKARRLDEELKPENIERSLAGIGSTKPEELREMRRRQLTIEKEGVEAQLRLLATSRERLENAIRTLDGRAYQMSAEDKPPVTQMLFAPNAIPRQFILIGAVAVAILGALLIVLIRRRSAIRLR